MTGPAPFLVFVSLGPVFRCLFYFVFLPIKSLVLVYLYIYIFIYGAVTKISWAIMYFWLIFNFFAFQKAKPNRVMLQCNHFCTTYLNVLTDFDMSPVLPFLFIETSGCHFFLNTHTQAQTSADFWWLFQWIDWNCLTWLAVLMSIPFLMWSRALSRFPERAARRKLVAASACRRWRRGGSEHAGEYKSLCFCAFKNFHITAMTDD